MRYPLKQTVMVDDEPVKVFGWAVVDTALNEYDSDAVGTIRLRARLEIYAPAAALPVSGLVALPDGSLWTLDGGPRDYGGNPWWQPGLAVHVAHRAGQD